LLGDAIEAIIAAVYLDAGLTSRALICGVVGSAGLQVKQDARDVQKTAFAGMGTGARLCRPRLVQTDRQGPDHAPCVYHHAVF